MRRWPSGSPTCEWLDVNHCKPSVFARSGRRLDRLIYRISFDSAADAHLFAQQFARYLPVTRRANPFERDRLRAMAASTACGDGRALGAAD
jgi:hypothetical protein